MQKQIEELNKKISQAEEAWQRSKDALFKSKEAVAVLKEDIATVKGRHEALMEVRNTLIELEAEKKLKPENKKKK